MSVDAKKFFLGTISSHPDYEDGLRYPNYFKRTNIIIVDERSLIQVNFTSFAVEDGSYFGRICPYDYLRITDGDGTVFVDRICGSATDTDDYEDGYGGGNGNGDGNGNAIDNGINTINTINGNGNESIGNVTSDSFGNGSTNANNSTNNSGDDGFGYRSGDDYNGDNDNGNGSDFTGDGSGNVFRKDADAIDENGRSDDDIYSFGKKSFKESDTKNSRKKRQSGPLPSECTEEFGYGGYGNGSCAEANDENQITIENILNKTILSKTNVLIFTFVTDYSVTDKGWNAIWESVTPGL